MNLCVYIELLYRQEETDNRAVFKAQLTQRCTGKSRPRTSSAESKMGFRRRLVPHTYAMQRADTSTPKYPLHHMKTKKQRVMLARSTAKNLENFPISDPRPRRRPAQIMRQIAEQDRVRSGVRLRDALPPRARHLAGRLDHVQSSSPTPGKAAGRHFSAKLKNRRHCT